MKHFRSILGATPNYLFISSLCKRTTWRRQKPRVRLRT